MPMIYPNRLLLGLSQVELKVGKQQGKYIITKYVNCKDYSCDRLVDRQH
nr:hypothetical protein [Nostoc sp. EkiNYC01]